MCRERPRRTVPTMNELIIRLSDTERAECADR